jgi:hypothetical protein
MVPVAACFDHGIFPTQAAWTTLTKKVKIFDRCVPLLEFADPGGGTRGVAQPYEPFRIGEPESVRSLVKASSAKAFEGIDKNLGIL